MRTFVALNFSAETRVAMHSATAPLRERWARGVSWLPESALHVTLAFLGERESSFVDMLTDRLRAGTRSLAAPELHVHVVGSFPSLARPRVLWLGVDLNPEVARLYQSVASTCDALGVARETRPFHPHVTFGRVRVGTQIDAKALVHEAVAVTYEARERAPSVDVMESVLGGGGARYRVAASIPLNTMQGND